LLLFPANSWLEESAWKGKRGMFNETRRLGNIIGVRDQSIHWPVALFFLIALLAGLITVNFFSLSQISFFNEYYPVSTFANYICLWAVCILVFRFTRRGSDALAVAAAIILAAVIQIILKKLIVGYLFADDYLFLSAQSFFFFLSFALVLRLPLPTAVSLFIGFFLFIYPLSIAAYFIIHDIYSWEFFRIMFLSGSDLSASIAASAIFALLFSGGRFLFRKSGPSLDLAEQPARFKKAISPFKKERPELQTEPDQIPPSEIGPEKSRAEIFKESPVAEAGPEVATAPEILEFKTGDALKGVDGNLTALIVFRKAEDNLRTPQEAKLALEWQEACLGDRWPQGIIARHHSHPQADDPNYRLSKLKDILEDPLYGGNPVEYSDDFIYSHIGCFFQAEVAGHWHYLYAFFKREKPSAPKKTGQIFEQGRINEQALMKAFRQGKLDQEEFKQKLNDMQLVNSGAIKELLNSKRIENNLKKMIIEVLDSRMMLEDIAQDLNVKFLSRKMALLKLKDQKLIHKVLRKVKEEVEADDLVDLITDGELITDLAAKAYHESVRFDALKKIQDQTFLEEIALKDKSYDVRLSAVERIENQDFLAKTVKSKDYLAIRKAALNRLQDQRHIIDLYRTETDPYLLETALSKVEDQQFLEEIARSDQQSDRRRLAVERLKNQSVLADIAANDTWIHARQAAVPKLNHENKDLLIKLARKDRYQLIRELAEKRLRALNIPLTEPDKAGGEPPDKTLLDQSRGERVDKALDFLKKPVNFQNIIEYTESDLLSESVRNELPNPGYGRLLRKVVVVDGKACAVFDNVRSISSLGSKAHWIIFLGFPKGVYPVYQFFGQSPSFRFFHKDFLKALEDLLAQKWSGPKLTEAELTLLYHKLSDSFLFGLAMVDPMIGIDLDRYDLYVDPFGFRSDEGEGALEKYYEKQNFPQDSGLKKSSQAVSSKYALELRCMLCGKIHQAETWPVRGDFTSFYFQEEKGNYFTTIYCPYQDQEWYVVWDADPGEFFSTGAERAQPLDQDTLSRTKVMKHNPVFFKIRVKKTKLTIEPEIDLQLYDAIGYNKEGTWSLLVSTEYSLEEYERAKHRCKEAGEKCIELSAEEYSKIYREYDGCPPPEDLF